MKLSFSVVLLIVLGIVAAGAAAMFTATLSAGNLGQVLNTTVPDVTILVAKEDMPITTPIRESDIVEKVVPATSAPANFFTDPAQIIGRRLVSDMFVGQAFTRASFPDAGTGVQLATQIPEGKRAVSIMISSYESLQGLLYPGATVDVLASFRVGGRQGQALSTTLLQNIQVLAVANMIVGDNSELEKEDGRVQSRTNNKPSVTLLVTAKQAEGLQLAMKFGQISLTMRNPSDSNLVDEEATLLSQGILAELATLLGTSVSDDIGGEIPLDILDKVLPVEVQPESDPVPAAVREPVKVSKTTSVQVVRGLQVKQNVFHLDD